MRSTDSTRPAADDWRAVLQSVARGEADFSVLERALLTSSCVVRNLQLLQQIRAQLTSPHFADDLAWLEHTQWPPAQRRPVRALDVGLSDFDASGRCADWGPVVTDAYKVARVLQAYYDDAARYFVSSLPDGEDVERAALDAVQSSTISLAAQIPFAIGLHRVWAARDGDALARLLAEADWCSTSSSTSTTTSASASLLLHNERVRLGRLAVRCVELERDAHSPLFALLLRSDMTVLHESVGEVLGLGSASGYEWILDAWIERAATALFAWNWSESSASSQPPAAMLSTAPLPATAARAGSLRQHLQECVRTLAISMNANGSSASASASSLSLSLSKMQQRLLHAGVVTAQEWRDWRAFDKDVLCEFIDAVLSQITCEHSTMPARSPSSPLTSPGAFEHSPSLLLRTYYATSAMGPTVALLLDAWVEHVLPLRLDAMARASASIAWPARCPPAIEEAAGIALGMLSRRSGVLKLAHLERLLRAGRRQRISVHFVLLVVRDVARAGRHPVAPLESDDRRATAQYRAFLDGDFSSVESQRAIHATLACDDLTVCAGASAGTGATGAGAAVEIAFGSHAARERLHRLSVVLLDLESATWRAALQVWSGLDYGEPGSDQSDDDWWTHVVRPALVSWRASSSSSSSSTLGTVPAASASASACVDHATEMLDGPARVAYDDLAARIADMQRALQQTVQRDEVSHAIRTNEVRETSDADVNAIRAEPLLFKYFEAFCYRMNETYAGCMGKLSGQVKSNAGGHKVNFGALFNILPDVFGLKAGVALVLAPAVIAMRMRSAGQACDFVRLASDPEEFAQLARAVAVRILSDDRKRRQLRYALARDESQSVSLRNIRASVRRMQRSRYDTTVSRFAVHDAQVLVDAVMDGDLEADAVERLRRTGDIEPLANALTAIVIQRTVTNTEEQDGCNEGSKLGVVLQAAAGAAKPYAAAPRALAAVVSKVL